MRYLPDIFRGGGFSAIWQRAYVARAILLGIITLASFEVTSMLNAALMGAAAMLIAGCCSIAAAWHKGSTSTRLQR